MFISEQLPVMGYHGGCSHLAAVEQGLVSLGVHVRHLWLRDATRWRPFGLPFGLPAGVRLHVSGAKVCGNWILPMAWKRRESRAAAMRRVVSRCHPGVVILDRVTTARQWERVDGVSAWVLTHDLLHRRSQLGLLDATAEVVTWETERSWLLRADGVIAIQDGEAEFLREQLPERPVIVVPHPLTPHPLAILDDPEFDMLFIGGSAIPNREAVNWFVDEVLPLVRKHRPRAKLAVAGTICEHVADHAAVIKLGHVADLQSLYARSAVCVAPVRRGTGMKIKVVEAMAYGRPVVCTTAAVDGTSGLESAVAACVDSPEDFAAAVIRLTGEKVYYTTAVERQLSWIRERLVPEVSLLPLVEKLTATDAGDC